MEVLVTVSSKHGATMAIARVIGDEPPAASKPR